MPNRIKNLRKDLQLTLDDLATKTGIKRGTLNNYENGKTEPKIETWYTLSDFFDVPIAYLMGIDNRRYSIKLQERLEKLTELYLDEEPFKTIFSTFSKNELVDCCVDYCINRFSETRKLLLLEDYDLILEFYYYILDRFPSMENRIEVTSQSNQPLLNMDNSDLSEHEKRKINKTLTDLQMLLELLIETSKIKNINIELPFFPSLGIYQQDNKDLANEISKTITHLKNQIHNVAYKKDLKDSYPDYIKKVIIKLKQLQEIKLL